MVSLDGLYAGWNVLNDLLGDLSRRGAFIPEFTYAQLRNSKMSLEYLRSFREDISSRNEQDEILREEMEHTLIDLRETLMGWAQQHGGREYRESWEQRFESAIREELRMPEEEEEAPVPITALPRERDVAFFRIRLPDNIPVEVISEIAEDCRVNISLDGERHLQVSGDKECVRHAMKRLGKLFYGTDGLSKS